MRNQEQILSAVRARFGSELRVVDFVGGELSFAQQADLFRAAGGVVGPHGAALANLIFCQAGTRVIEYVQMPHFPLYMGYANVFDLTYWPVLDESFTATVRDITARRRKAAPKELNRSRHTKAATGEYAGISENAVVHVVGCALSFPPSLLTTPAADCGDSRIVKLNSEHLLLQSESNEGWTSINRKLDEFKGAQPWP